MPGMFRMHELVKVHLDGFTFQGVYDPLGDPCKPAMVLLQSVLAVLGFARRSPEDTTPPITHTVIVCPDGEGGIYKAYQADVLTLETVRETIRTKQKLIEEWRNDA